MTLCLISDIAYIISKERLPMFDWTKIETDSQINELCALAKKIWNEYSTCFISQEQIDYMLEKFQSEQAVKRQIDYERYQYYFLEEDGINFGYFAIQPQKDYLFLSKIYIDKEHRGKGFAKKAFVNAIIPIAKRKRTSFNQTDCKQVQYTFFFVYTKKLGFVRIDSVETDIGGGYIMDDYIYEYTI